MKLSKKKLEIALAEKRFTNKDLATAAGLSRQRIGVLLNSQRVQPKSVGKLAAALGVGVDEIIE